MGEAPGSITTRDLILVAVTEPVERHSSRAGNEISGRFGRHGRDEPAEPLQTPIYFAFICDRCAGLFNNVVRLFNNIQSVLLRQPFYHFGIYYYETNGKLAGGTRVLY